jgi:6-pyruvoyltetrahydropterin/6-carboxytetrahydropterin synthase
MFEIVVTRTFSAAHALTLPDGTCESTHGHDWQVQVTVGRDQLDSIETVMDFHQLEAMVDAIITPWHNNYLNDCAPFCGEGGRLLINPSAERVAQTIAQALPSTLPDAVCVVEVLVSEAPGCQARYRADETK